MHCPVSLKALFIIFCIFAAGTSQAQMFSSIEEIDVPSGDAAEEPSLVALPDGRVLMSWTELTGDVHAAVRVAVHDGGGWSDPVTVVEGDDLFVSYADFPSAVALPDGTLAVSWLRMNGTSAYAYDVNITLSSDGGATWGQAVVPHRDGTARQHGFVSLLPDGPDGVLAMWLDGRNYDTTDSFAGGDSATDAMALRATTLATDGSLSEDLLLDDRTCTCCQTSATTTDDGTVLLAYRDRTANEIRDISVIRRVDDVWAEPIPVSGDGWEIAGCPVNGPAIDADGDHAALVWFTGAKGIPAVKVAFSADRGASFGSAMRIDLGGPMGRVDVLQLDDGTALVSWLEMTAAGEALLLCRVAPNVGCETPLAVTVTPSGRSIGFARMTQVGEDVYIAWTEPSRDTSGRPDGGTFIRAARATLEAAS